jgi:hypothetical protein
MKARSEPARRRGAGLKLRSEPACRRGARLGLTGSAILGTLALCSCGSSDMGDDGSAATGAGQRVVLGTGEAEFEPIEGEPRLRLVAGAQGGFHVWASFLAYGFVSTQVDLVLETRVEDDPAQSLVMHAHLVLREVADPSGEPAQSFAGFPAQIYDARCAQDKPVSVHLTLADSSGATAEDTFHCVADVDPQQRGPDCD